MYQNKTINRQGAKMLSKHLQIDKLSEFQIQSCYDSHVHWLMTGEKKSFLNLETVESLCDVSNLEIKKSHFKGEWLMGFGWQDMQFQNNSPHFKYLDQISSEYPICFIKKDAHSCLLNSKALNLFLKHFAGEKDKLQFLDKDEGNNLTGVLKESTFYLLFTMLPENSDEKIKDYLLQGQSYFIENGFTHIRDMTCSLKQFKILEEMENHQQIKIYADLLFNVETLDDLKCKLESVLESRNKNLKHLSVQGIKLFMDGSLGSQTALLSEPYLESSSVGYKLWTDEDLKSALTLVWSKGLHISIHTLGDESVKCVVQIARELQQKKITGVMHLEHVELLSAETVQLMKGLHIRCHMQPCHWLTDQKWIDQRLSPALKKNLFRWESLRKNKIPFYFGSDSPIEEASVFLNLRALEDSVLSGIEKINDDYLKYFSHPTQKNGKTFFKEGQVSKVYIDESLVFNK